jgi:hypothetical protein
MKVTYLLFYTMIFSAVSSATASDFFTKHYEAEKSTAQSGCEIDTENFPYVGSGYMVMPKKSAYVEWGNITVPSGGEYTLIIKFANGTKKARPCDLNINGEAVETVPFKPVYKDWCHYWNARVAVKLNKGENVIRLTAATDAGGPNIDNIAVSSAFSVATGKQFDVKSYGAKGDGSTNDTKAIQDAIDACTPGGSVVLTHGVFMSGKITLKSDMTFWIDQTATLKAIQDQKLFPVTDPPTNNVSVADELGKAFIYSQGADNLTITGGGTVDGNGKTKIWNGKKDESIRPIPLYPTQGKNIKITNLDIVEGAMWNVVPLECDDVVIDGLNIYTSFGKNKDGIDPCDCHRVLVTNCTLYVEDDALCPKSGHVRGCEDITYRNITVNQTICGLIKLGTKSYGHFKNIVFEDLALYGHIGWKESNVGINISTVDGADIDGITVRRVNMREAATAVFILHGAGRTSRNPVGSPDKPGRYVKNILIEDVDARECHDPIGNFITGAKSKSGELHKVTDVTLRNVKVECKGGVNEVPEDPKEFSGEYPNYNWNRSILPAYGYYIRHAENITFENCSTTVSPTDAREEMVLVNAENITVTER